MIIVGARHFYRPDGVVVTKHKARIINLGWLKFQEAGVGRVPLPTSGGFWGGVVLPQQKIVHFSFRAI